MIVFYYAVTGKTEALICKQATERCKREDCPHAESHERRMGCDQLCELGRGYCQEVETNA